MMTMPVSVGDPIPGFSREVVQADINKYAEASGDYNPIHINEEFAKATPLGGTIAHGMLVLAYMSEMLARAFGDAWDSTGHFSARFRSPARPGDKLEVAGNVESVSEEGDIVVVTCSLSCRNQADEVVVSGEARVGLPGR